jgi:hypothetical protein
MPDTGAPWNIPYVENADLVSDWPADSLLVANAVAAGLSAAGGLVAVASVTKTDTFSMSSSTFADVTGLTVSITPQDDSHKIFVIATVECSVLDSTAQLRLRLMRGATPIAIGDAAGSRPIGTSFGAVSETYLVTNKAMTVLDSPNTDLAVTYAVQIASTSAAAVYVNRSPADTDNTFHPRVVSSLTLMEVKV